MYERRRTAPVRDAVIARRSTCRRDERDKGETDMRTTILSMALVAMIGAADGFAQGTSSMPKNSGGASGGGVIQAPVGHRQPRAGDVPSEKNLSDPNDPLSKENAALD